jgi:hypothetical protein
LFTIFQILSSFSSSFVGKWPANSFLSTCLHLL